MPYIKTTTNVEINSQIKDSLKSKLGEAITALPGKTERWLMLSFEGNTPMSFGGGTDENYAFVDVSIFGTASAENFEKLTAAITKVIGEELAVKPENTYVKYEEVKHWGWNGGNF